MGIILAVGMAVFLYLGFGAGICLLDTLYPVR